MSTTTTTTPRPTTTTTPPAAAEHADPNDLASLYQPLRVCDVADALDGIGYFNIGLMDREVRPLWQGMRFWGEAATIRCVPSNKPMWRLDSTEDIVAAHSIWFEQNPPARLPDDLKPGHVVVMDSGGGPEVGFWGSENSMSAVLGGAVGIITDGYCRDTAEVVSQRTPIVARHRGRTIIPGRIMAIETQVHDRLRWGAGEPRRHRRGRRRRRRRGPAPRRGGGRPARPGHPVGGHAGPAGPLRRARHDHGRHRGGRPGRGLLCWSVRSAARCFPRTTPPRPCSAGSTTRRWPARAS